MFQIVRGRGVRVGVATTSACLLIVGVSLIGVSTAVAVGPTTLYAAVTAAGSGDCSSVANACTLTTALADTAAGDVVALVTAGVEGNTSTYYSGGFSIGTTGTSATLPVVIEPAPGISKPIMDGSNAEPSGQTVLSVSNDMYLAIDGVIIQNGPASIFSDSGATITVTDSTISNVALFEDGAIFNNGTLNVTDSTINGSSRNFAGAIENSGTLTVTDSTIGGRTQHYSGAIDNSGSMTATGSTITGTDGDSGGAISNSGSLTVTDSTISGTAGDDGGGAISNGGTLAVTGSTISGTTGTECGGCNSDKGGAIDNTSGATANVTGSTLTGTALDGGAIANAGTLSVRDSTFTNSHGTGTPEGGGTAGYGGAIDNADNGGGTLTVTDSTFTGNSAIDDGGAIDNADNGGTGTLSVTGSTFSENTAPDGQIIDNGNNGGTGTVIAAGNIFAGRCTSAGTWTDDGYNAGKDTSCQNGGTGDVVSAHLAKTLAPLGNNGGPTQTILLLPGNAASGLIPNGTNVLCPVGADQTGQPSPMNAPCNAGALQPHPIIASVAVKGTASAPKVVVKGSGFGTVTNLGAPVPAADCGGGTGSDYTNNTLTFVDHTQDWNAGKDHGGTCSRIGLIVSTYSNTEVVFTFGSSLAGSGGVKAGASVTVTLLGAAETFTAAI
jgi:hypothetical protein